MTLKYFILIFSLFLTACDVVEPPKIISQEIQQFEIFKVYPPKHFYVDLKTNTGLILSHVYVSKHCNRWREIKIPSTVLLNIITYQQKNEIFTEIKTYSICPGN